MCYGIKRKKNVTGLHPFELCTLKIFHEYSGRKLRNRRFSIKDMIGYGCHLEKLKVHQSLPLSSDSGQAQNGIDKIYFYP